MYIFDSIFYRDPIFIDFYVHMHFLRPSRSFCKAPKAPVGNLRPQMHKTSAVYGGLCRVTSDQTHCPPDPILTNSVRNALTGMHQLKRRGFLHQLPNARTLKLGLFVSRCQLETASVLKARGHRRTPQVVEMSGEIGSASADVAATLPFSDSLNCLQIFFRKIAILQALVKKHNNKLK